MRIALLLLAFAAPLAAAETAGQELNRMEALWRSKAVESYVFRPFMSINPLGTAEFRVTIRNQKVRKIERQDLKGQWRRFSMIFRKRSALVPPLTVEDVFQSIRDYLDPDGRSGTILYDANFGYPIHARFNGSPDVYDDEFEVGIAYFETAK